MYVSELSQVGERQAKPAAHALRRDEVTFPDVCQQRRQHWSLVCAPLVHIWHFLCTYCNRSDRSVEYPVVGPALQDVSRDTGRSQVWRAGHCCASVMGEPLACLPCRSVEPEEVGNPRGEGSRRKIVYWNAEWWLTGDAFSDGQPDRLCENNNNYQVPALPGPIANPTPGTIVIHMNGKAQTTVQSSWTSSDRVHP